MSVDFHVIIPARYDSSRLHGKVLLDVQGQTILERVYRQALKAKPSSITIATDHAGVFDVAQAFGCDVIMTAKTHESGTSRITEALDSLSLLSNDIVVNVQGDEPLMAPELITQVAQSLHHSSAPVATLCYPIENQEQALNPNVVKVVRNVHNHALYFSRSLIPFHREDPTAIESLYRHVGIYAYRAQFLKKMSTWEACSLARTESLEQLSVLWAGYSIQVDEACVKPLQDVNTAEDLQAIQAYLQNLVQ